MSSIKRTAIGMLAWAVLGWPLAMSCGGGAGTTEPGDGGSGGSDDPDASVGGQGGGGAGGGAGGAGGTIGGTGGSVGGRGGASGGAGGSSMSMKDAGAGKEAGGIAADAAAGGTGGGKNDASAPDVVAPVGYKLVWSDEFNDADGTPPDFAKKWTADLGWGDGGWGNNELQYYTNTPENIVQQGGNLVINARQDNVAGKTCGGKACQYTSARIHTKGKFEQMYGRFEARIKVPSGNRMWPAFWMMGNDFPKPADWPQCGEIDIMEIWGYDPTVNAGTTHDPGNGTDLNYQDNGVSGEYTLPNKAQYASDFHVFAIEWEAEVVRFSVDGNFYHCVLSQTADATKCGSTKATRLPAQGKWVFDHPFFMLLNLAADSEAPADAPGTTYPRSLLVDYVRVYQKQ